MGLKMTLDSLKLSLAPEGCQTCFQQGMTYAKSGVALLPLLHSLKCCLDSATEPKSPTSRTR
jgi:hypothetical protein